MQEARLPLLRLGRQLQGHEVRFSLPPSSKPSQNTTNSAVRSVFIREKLSAFAAAHPQIEVTVSPRPGRHPVVRGTYINGREKAICVKNLEPDSVMKKVKLLRDASGEVLRKETKPVKSINESVRGVWSPYHSGPMTV
jgi:large subunit ribosomal protein L43